MDDVCEKIKLRAAARPQLFACSALETGSRGCWKIRLRLRLKDGE
jgi:hypothetical protein